MRALGAIEHVFVFVRGGVGGAGVGVGVGHFGGFAVAADEGPVPLIEDGRGGGE